MVNYNIRIKSSAVKELNHLPGRELKRITRKIKDLENNPRPFGCEKLSTQEKYRIRQGDYRIIYSIDDAELIVHIYKIVHRRDVYK